MRGAMLSTEPFRLFLLLFQHEFAFDTGQSKPEIAAFDLPARDISEFLGVAFGVFLEQFSMQATDH